MRPAAAYFQRFTWEPHTQGSPDTYGEPADVTGTPVSVWGFIDSASASRTNYLESPINIETTTIRLRNFLDVSILDTLTEQRFGDVYEVRSVYRDVPNLETVIEGRKLG